MEKHLNKSINVTSDTKVKNHISGGRIVTSEIRVKNHISGGRTSDTVALKNFLYRKAR